MVRLIISISPVYAKTRQKSQLRMKVGMIVHHLRRSSWQLIANAIEIVSFD